MEYAEANAPLFIEAFYAACESLSRNEQLYAPDVGLINRILAKTDAGYKIELPDLIVLRDQTPIAVDFISAALNSILGGACISWPEGCPVAGAASFDCLTVHIVVHDARAKLAIDALPNYFTIFPDRTMDAFVSFSCQAEFSTMDFIGDQTLRLRLKLHERKAKSPHPDSRR